MHTQGKHFELHHGKFSQSPLDPPLPPYFTWDQSEQYEHFLFDRTFELGRI